MQVNTDKAEIVDNSLVLNCPSCSSKITVDHEKNVKAEVLRKNSDSENKGSGLDDEKESPSEDTIIDNGSIEKDWLGELFS